MLCRSFPGSVLLAAVLTLSVPTSAAPVLSIAHRGNSRYAPENTLAAFRAAQGKADVVETDAHVSSDGKLVIMHDSTVDRTTDGTGAIASLTLAQLKLLDAGSWFGPSFAGERVPTLEEMITNTLPFATPLIERKAGAASVYVNELRRLNAVTNVLVQSFDWAFLAAVHALEPNLRLGALGSGTFTASTLTSITNSGATIVAWEKASVTPAVVGLVRGAGLDLYVWTVDGSADIQNFIALGVDGIISNDPAAVRGQHVVVTNKYELVAYWKMDDGLAEPFTTTVADSQGANTATLVRNDGASHWLGLGTAHLGGCLRLDGTNAFVIVPQTPDLNINTNALTFSAWVWLTRLPSQLTSSYGAIFDSTTDCYVLYLDRNNRELRFKITDDVGHAARPGIPEALLPTNQWLHIAATYDGAATSTGGRAAIYLDAQLMDAHTGSDGNAQVGLTGNVKTGQAAAMGREGPTGGNHFTGFVDDVAIWRRALKDSDIMRIHAAGQEHRSLADLLSESLTSLRLTSINLNAAGTQLEISFRHEGFWTVFQLERATSCGGPYSPVPELAPVSLGDGLYQFTYALGAGPMEYFRVVAR